MARLLGDHCKNEQAKFAVIEGTPASAFAVVMVSATMVMMAIHEFSGLGVMATRAAPMSVLHANDIDRDISRFKIYLNYRFESGARHRRQTTRADDHCGMWNWLKGFPVGFFAEEMTRAFLIFTEAGHTVDLASPSGGEVMIDTHSDPRTPNGAYADDLISLGFIHHARFGEMLRNTLPINSVSVEDYDAVWVAGGGRPLLTFKDDTDLHALIASFYEKGKSVALICHGSSLLLWARLSNGRLLAEGRKWTGFTDAEEEAINTAFGMKLNDYTIEDEASRIDGTTFIWGVNEPFAIRDGRLITGQQQYSSGVTAELVLEALDEY